MLQFVHQARRSFHRQKDYENLLLTHFSPGGNPDRNRGERYNCSLALYQVRKRVAGQIIMLIDDMKACRGLLKWYNERFKTTATWTSLDLLLHVYLVTYPKWPQVQARAALRTVIPRMGGTQAEITKRIRNSDSYLQELYTMLKALPRVKKV